MVAMFAYWVNVGSIIGSIVVNYTKRSMTKSSYQIPIGCLYIVPTVLCIALFFVPESPRWLLYRGRDAEARRSLEILRGGIDQTEVEIEWAEMLRGVEEEKKALTTAHFWDMFKGRLSAPWDGPLFSLQAIVLRNPSNWAYANLKRRCQSPPYTSLLWNDCMPNSKWNLVPHRLSNLLPHHFRCRTSF